MNNIVFISDFFLDEAMGGAEKCNEAFINKISGTYNVTKKKSTLVTVDFIKNHREDFFIIANFFGLSQKVKIALGDCDYIIYEHDHKYVSNNNPSTYKNFEIPIRNIINIDFYSLAKAVLCQSTFHSEILYKNTLLTNIVNLSGNIWSDEDLELLNKNISNDKNIKNAIMRSGNRNKGESAAVRYCKSNNIEFDYIESQSYESFINNLSKVENLYFFPQWVETYNRVSIEARILGCKLITNNLIGVTKESYYKLKGKELLDFIKKNNDNVVNKILNVVEQKEVEFFKTTGIPKVTFITSMYKGAKFIEHFLKNITSLDLFETSEVLIFDSNSPENEYSICKPYLEKYDNIKYKRLEKNYSPTEVLNLGIKESTGEYLTTAPIDDVRDKLYLRWMIKSLLETGEDTCLVYGECLQTNTPNETINLNTASSIYEHSKQDFSRENMIKSLPGPMPVWKKNIHKEIGYFNTKYRYCADWELWLRMVNKGYKFRKLNKIIGLYYFNKQGLTTSDDTKAEKNTEEAEVFFKFKETFGESNYKRYFSYFNQFRRNND
jgi:GT2 family glycosyltransferase